MYRYTYAQVAAAHFWSQRVTTETFSFGKARKGAPCMGSEGRGARFPPQARLHLSQLQTAHEDSKNPASFRGVKTRVRLRLV